MLNEATRGQWIVLLVSLALGIGLTLMLGVEAAHLVALGAPELIAFAAVFDVALAVELTVAALVVAGRAKLISLRTLARDLATRIVTPQAAVFVRHLRARASRPKRRPRANECSEDRPAAGLAVA